MMCWVPGRGPERVSCRVRSVCLLDPGGGHNLAKARWDLRSWCCRVVKRNDHPAYPKRPKQDPDQGWVVPAGRVCAGDRSYNWGIRDGATTRTRAVEVALLVSIRLRGVGLVDMVPVIVVVNRSKRSGFSARLPPGFTPAIDRLVVILQLWKSSVRCRRSTMGKH